MVYEEKRKNEETTNKKYCRRNLCETLRTLRLSDFARNFHRSAWFLARALSRKVRKGLGLDRSFLVAAEGCAGNQRLINSFLLLLRE